MRQVLNRGDVAQNSRRTVGCSDETGTVRGSQAVRQPQDEQGHGDQNQAGLYGRINVALQCVVDQQRHG